MDELEKRCKAAEENAAAALAGGGGEASAEGGPQRRAAGSGRLLPVSGQPHALALTGHRDTVTCVRAHPVFGIVASGSDDATVGRPRLTIRWSGLPLTAACRLAHWRQVKVWDAETGALEKTLRGHRKAVTGLAFGGTDWLASSSSDLTVKLWAMNKGERRLRSSRRRSWSLYFPSSSFSLARSTRTRFQGTSALAR